MKNIFLAVTMLISSFATLAQEFKTLKDKAYIVQYPNDWKYSNYNSDNGNFMFYTDLKDEKDGFSENVNLVIQDIEGMGYNLDNFSKLSESQVKGYLENAEITTSETYEKDGYNYQKLVYTGTINGFDLKFIQHYYITEKNSYILTYTSEQSQFEGYENQAMVIFDSFKLNQ